MALFWIKNIRTLAMLVVFAAALTACGSGGGTAAPSSGNGYNGEIFYPSDETLGGSQGDLGITTISAQTENYDMVVSIGDSAPVGLVQSEAGHYVIESNLSF